MNEDTKQILEAIGALGGKVSGLDTKVSNLDSKVANLDNNVTGLGSKVATLDSKIESVRVEMMGELSRVEHRLYNEIADVHKDLSNRLDNHDGFTKEIDHVIGRVKFVEDHLGLQVA